MTRALAIETSTRTGSVALARDGEVLTEEQFPHGLQNAAQIVPIIDRLIRAQGWRPREIEHVYVSAGPGSFTGLRIGVTLAKSLALATGAGLVAVPSVRVLVENAPAEAGHVVVVLDAKRNQIFTARFERVDGRWIERAPAQLATLVEMVLHAPRPLFLIGEGIPVHERFISSDDADVVITPPTSWRPRAAVVARLGHELAADRHFIDPDRIAPIYIRRPEAEEKFEAARKS